MMTSRWRLPPLQPSNDGGLALVPRCASSMTAPWGPSPRRGLRLEAMISKAPASVMGITLPPVDLCGHRQADPHVSSNVAPANVLLHRHQTSLRRKGDKRVAQSRGARRRCGVHVREATEAGSFRFTGIRHCSSFISGERDHRGRGLLGLGLLGQGQLSEFLSRCPFFS
jgi:hypothetical protein